MWRLWESWATRSLVVGAMATGIDLAVGLSLLALGVSTLVAARVGVAIGGTFAFAANRYFAFKQHNPRLSLRSLAFIVSMGVVVAAAGAWAAGLVPEAWRGGWLIGVVLVALSIPLQVGWLRQTDPELKGQVVRFVVSTVLSMWAHGLLVEWLRDSLGVPFALSKVLADLVVFSVLQLLVLRFLVFSRRPAGASGEGVNASPGGLPPPAR